MLPYAAVDFHAAHAAARDELDRLPDVVQRALSRVEVRLCGERELRLYMDAPPGVRGVFLGRQAATVDGAEIDEALIDDAAALVPPRGFVFLVAENLADADDVRATLLHEIGHALGLDESQVAELGLSEPHRMHEGAA